MFIEFGRDYAPLLALAPIIGVTIHQAKAIFERDHHTCTFPFDHVCKGKLTIHHIEDKEDNPTNLTTVCHNAHWHHLHHGATEEQKDTWREELTKVASTNTQTAIEQGWTFPEGE